MTAPAQRQAVAALDAARQVVARLDASRDPEDVAADLIEGWSAVETALRSLLGGSALSGTALVSEVRQRQLLSYDQANALAAFHAARDRAERTAYHPTQADMEAARQGFLKLEAALMPSTPAAGVDELPSAVAPAAPPRVSGSSPAVVTAAAPVGAPANGARNWLLAFAVLAAVVIIALAGYFAFQRYYGGGSAALARGVQLYKSGNRAQARTELARAARDEPNSALPHVYLARMAREEGDFGTAARELEAAIRADPKSAIALREMGALQFQAGQYDLARRFYVRAIQADQNDRTAMGYLGCTLVRLGRPDEGARWLNRAGTGPWSGCVQPAAPPGSVPGGAAPGTVPPA